MIVQPSHITSTDMKYEVVFQIKITEGGLIIKKSLSCWVVVEEETLYIKYTRWKLLQYIIMNPPTVSRGWCRNYEGIVNLSERFLYNVVVNDGILVKIWGNVLS